MSLKSCMGFEGYPSYAPIVMGDVVTSRDPSFYQTNLDMIEVDSPSLMMQ